MTRIILSITLLVSTSSFGQQFWGSLTPGQYPVGFKIIREHDDSRGNRPMLVAVWYPGKQSASAKTVLFKDYLASGIINSSFSPPSDSEKKFRYDDFHQTMERPFVSGGQKISGSEWNRVLNIASAAKWDLPEAAGKFPTVLMSSEPEGLSITAEYLASNGFVVAAVNAPYDGQQQPPDSLLWVEPAADILWLKNYTRTLKNTDQSKLAAIGFGGGIQSAFFLTMKTSDINALVNLEGGVFGQRSLTDKSVEYEPSKMKSTMLHIVTPYQRNEDDLGQVNALVNTKLYPAYIQNEGLRHHDFSIYGRVLNKGLNMRGTLADNADQAFVAVHKMILEFLKLASGGKANTFAVDRRFMPHIALENSASRSEPGLVLHQPAMDNVMIEQGKTFKTVNDTSLVFDVYYPRGFDKKHELPVVVFVNGVGSMQLHRWKIYQDWGRLVAANGFVAVNYQTRRNHALDDSESLLDHLAAHSTELSIDKEKIGLWSCSANVSTGLPLAMQEKRGNVKALVVYYGMVQAPPNSNPHYRQDLEMLIVRAGLDFRNLNVGIENFVNMALLEDLHFDLINFPEGQHAFDTFDDTPRSREIILQTVDFFKRTLAKDHPVPEKSVLTNSRIWNGIIEQKNVDEVLTEWKEAVAMYRGMNHSQWYNHVIDERYLIQVGYALLDAGRVDDALKVFFANQEQFPASANAYDALGDAYEKAGDKAKAVSFAKKAIQKLTDQTDIPQQLREAIKASAEDKIRRLE
jgi:dienelactone hydrolase